MDEADPIIDIPYASHKDLVTLVDTFTGPDIISGYDLFREVRTRFPSDDYSAYVPIMAQVQNILGSMHYAREIENYAPIYMEDFVFVPPCAEKSWLHKDSQSPYYTQLPVYEARNGLDDFSLERVRDPFYLPQRSQDIRQAFDLGVHPYSFTPIHIVYVEEKEQFLITDGMHRMQIFHERGIPFINAWLHVE